MPSRILVIQTAFLGDLFLSIPLLIALRKKNPSARIALLCRTPFLDFFLKTGLVDEGFEVNKKDKVSLKSTIAKTIEFKPDLTVSAHRSFRTALWVRKINSAMRIGFQDPWNFWAYTHRVKRDLMLHDVLRQMSLLAPLNIKADEENLFPKIKLPAETKFKITDKAIALAPGSQWATKRWTLEGYTELAKKYMSLGFQVVVAGGKDEIEIGNEFLKQNPDALNLVGKTNIYELAQVLQACRLLVSNDSGAMHVAGVVGTPVVSIFGPTVPSQGYTPWSKNAKVVEINLGCRPCGAHGHQSCPIGTHDCMKKITSEKVFDAGAELL